MTCWFAAGILNGMSVYEIRKHLGDKHEGRVAEEFRKRGWRVVPYGMATQRPMNRAMIDASDSPLRYEPDLMVSPIINPSRVMLIDCKAQFNPDAAEVAINEQCMRAQLSLMGSAQLPIWYVFSDLSACTPGDVLTFGSLTNKVGGTWHYRMPRAQNRDFDSVFGKAPNYERTFAQLMVA